MVSALGNHARQHGEKDNDRDGTEHQHDKNDPGEYIKDAHDAALISGAEQG
jgi:hypothetical protein